MQHLQKCLYGTTESGDRVASVLEMSEAEAEVEVKVK